MVGRLFTYCLVVHLLSSTLVRSRTLLRGRLDDAVSVRLEKPKFTKPLGAPPTFLQQMPPGFKPPTQDICDQVAGMAKEEMGDGLVESSCDAVIYGASAKAPMGCECHFLGDKVKCPWGGPNQKVTQPMKDLGFNHLDNMGANAGAGSGSFKVQNCLYAAYRNPWPTDVEGGKIMQQEDHDDVLRMVKAMADSTEWARTFEEAPKYAATIGPWPVDEYGTPNCFGRCTTNPPNVWLRYTTTAPPGLL